MGVGLVLRRGYLAAYPAPRLWLAGANWQLDRTARAVLARGARGRRALRVGLRTDAAHIGVAVAAWRPLFGLRAVAAFEAVKGAIVLIAGFGLARLIGRDLQQAAAKL